MYVHSGFAKTILDEGGRDRKINEILDEVKKHLEEAGEGYR